MHEVVIRLSEEDLKPGKSKSKAKPCQDKITEITAAICALFNSNQGGYLKLCFDAQSVALKASEPKIIDDLVRRLEQSVIHFAGVATVSEAFKLEETKDDLVFVVKSTGRFCTIEYNLYLPTDFQVSVINSGDATTKIASLLDTRRHINDRVVTFQKHNKEFVYKMRVPKGLREGQTAQFKLLKDDATSNVTLADRMTNKSNKMVNCVSAFANLEGGKLYFGVDDKTYIVEGQVVNANEREKIKRKFLSVLSKMIWPVKEHKKFWRLDFVPVVVKGQERQQKDDTFVVVLTVAKCSGGVFVIEPESYHMVDGKVGRISMSVWKQKLIMDAEGCCCNNGCNSGNGCCDSGVGGCNSGVGGDIGVGDCKCNNGVGGCNSGGCNNGNGGCNHGDGGCNSGVGGPKCGTNNSNNGVCGFLGGVGGSKSDIICCNNCFMGLNRCHGGSNTCLDGCNSTGIYNSSIGGTSSGNTVPRNLQTYIPNCVGVIGWNSSKQQNDYMKVTQLMENLRNNGNWAEINQIAARVLVPGNTNADLKLAVTFQCTAAAYRQTKNKEAYELLQSYHDLIKLAKNPVIFEVQELYSWSAIKRSERDYQSSFRYTYDALQKMQFIDPGWITAWFLCNAASLLTIFASETTDPKTKHSLVHEAVCYYRAALEHGRSIWDYKQAAANLQHRVHINLAMLYMASSPNASSVNFETIVSADHLRSAQESLVAAVNFEGPPMSGFNEVYFLLAKSDLCFRYFQLNPETNQGHMKKAIYYATHGSEVAQANHFEEVLHYAEDRVCLLNSIPLKEQNMSDIVDGLLNDIAL